MAFAASIEPLTGPLPKVKFKWDSETEILSGQFAGGKAAAGLTGSVELTGADGAYIVLDVADGVVRGLEVVVWPETDIMPNLVCPAADEEGRLLLPARRSQPGIASVEVETALSASRTADGSTVRLLVGPKREAKAVRIADNLVLQLDRVGNIAAFWLLQVPPSPAPRE